MYCRNQEWIALKNLVHNNHQTVVRKRKQFIWNLHWNGLTFLSFIIAKFDSDLHMFLFWILKKKKNKDYSKHCNILNAETHKAIVHKNQVCYWLLFDQTPKWSYCLYTSRLFKKFRFSFWYFLITATKKYKALFVMGNNNGLFLQICTHYLQFTFRSINLTKKATYARIYRHGKHCSAIGTSIDSNNKHHQCHVVMEPRGFF